MDGQHLPSAFPALVVDPLSTTFDTCSSVRTRRLSELPESRCLSELSVNTRHTLGCCPDHSKSVSSLGEDGAIAQNSVTSPKSILKKRTPKPSPTGHSSFRSAITNWWMCHHRKQPILTNCAKRREPRVSFCNHVEVTSFSRAFGRDAVPVDGTMLAVGLGKPVSKGLALMAPKKRWGEPLKDVSELSAEAREKVLKDTLGVDRFQKAKDRHCDGTARVIQMRQESNKDGKEPPELMPTSYQMAKDRARKIATEVSTTTPRCFDSLASSPLSSPRSSPGRVQMTGLAARIKTAPSPCQSPQSKKLKVMSMCPPSASSSPMGVPDEDAAKLSPKPSPVAAKDAVAKSSTRSYKFLRRCQKLHLKKHRTRKSLANKADC